MAAAAASCSSLDGWPGQGVGLSTYPTHGVSGQWGATVPRHDTAHGCVLCVHVRQCLRQCLYLVVRGTSASERASEQDQSQIMVPHWTTHCCAWRGCARTALQRRPRLPTCSVACAICSRSANALGGSLSREGLPDLRLTMCSCLLKLSIDNLCCAMAVSSPSRLH